MLRRALALSSLSGLLLVASFPQLDLAVLAWFGLVPFFLALRNLEPPQAFLAGGLFGLLFFCGTLSWVTGSLQVYGRLPFITASLVTLLLCAYCALFPALAGAIMARIGWKRPVLFMIAAPSVWTALELARASVLSGFPWALLGYSQYRFLPLVQTAQFAGVYGISFLIVLVNAATALFLLDRKRFAPLIASAAILGAITAFGAVAMNRATPDLNGRPLRISVIQGNIDQDTKWDPLYQSLVIGTYHRLTEQALQEKPDLLLWPETSTPFYFGAREGDDARYSADLRAFIASLQTPLLAGSASYERKPDRTYVLRNAAFLLDRGGATGAVYYKIHLVPFGEYVPLRSLLFFAGKMVRTADDFQPGTEYTIM